MRAQRFWWGAVAIVLLVGILWSQRWIFSYRFDRVYLRHFFEHSQWSIPESPRVMSDSDLYQVAGEEIWRTGDLFRVSPETPPLGKMLYGAAIVSTGNPYWATVLGYFLVLAAAGVFHVIWLRRWSSAATAWLFTLSVPLLFTQLQYTNMDIWIVLFLYVALIGWLWSRRGSSVAAGLVLGIGLGGMAAVKVGLFAAALGSMLLINALWKCRWRLAIVALLSAGALYVATYGPYFAQGHGLLDWVRTQLWILHWYAGADTPRNLTALPSALVAGMFPTWWGAGWQRIPEWSVYWLLGLPLWWRWLRREGDGGLRWASLALVGTLVMVPLWPRYLLMVLPFWSGLIALAWPHWSRSVQKAVVVSIALSGIANFFPPPNAATQLFAEHLANGTYSEAFMMLTPAARAGDTREAFHRRWYALDQSVPNVQHTATIELPFSLAFWRHSRQGTLRLTYFSGPLTKTWTIPMTMERQAGRWVVDWSSAALPVVGDDRVVWQPRVQYQGALLTADGYTLSLDGPERHVVVRPPYIGNNRDVPKYAADAVGMRQTDLLARIYVLPLGAAEVSVGRLRPDVPPEVLSRLRHEAITFIDVPGRTYIRAATESAVLTAIEAEERQHPELYGRRGGWWGVQREQGPVELWWEGDPKNGEDVTLSAPFASFCSTCQNDSL